MLHQALLKYFSILKRHFFTDFPHCFDLKYCSDLWHLVSWLYGIILLKDVLSSVMYIFIAAWKTIWKDTYRFGMDFWGICSALKLCNGLDCTYQHFNSKYPLRWCSQINQKIVLLEIDLCVLWIFSHKNCQWRLMHKMMKNESKVWRKHANYIFIMGVRESRKGYGNPKRISFLSGFSLPHRLEACGPWQLNVMAISAHEEQPLHNLATNHPTNISDCDSTSCGLHNLHHGNLY